MTKITIVARRCEQNYVFVFPNSSINLLRCHSVLFREGLGGGNYVRPNDLTEEF